MKIQLKFKNINQSPECNIFANDILIYDGIVIPEIFYEIELDSKNVNFKIEFTNKNPEDTIVVDNNIVQDKNFELDKFIIDDYDFQELIWQGNYFAKDGQIFPGCLFFGPPGYFEIKFHQPVLHWILKTRNDINSNDPDWEIDYSYYTNACKLLTQISTKLEN